MSFNLSFVQFSSGLVISGSVVVIILVPTFDLDRVVHKLPSLVDDSISRRASERTREALVNY
jgi:hypothetical protein